MTDYKLKAKEIIATNLKLPIESIAEDARLTSLEQLDSLNFEGVVLGIEAFLGHKVDAIELLSLRSIGDVAKLLEKG